MKRFNIRKGNYIKSPDNTNKMMDYFTYSLIPLIIFSFYKNGINPFMNGYGNFYDIIKPIIFVFIPTLICLFTEYLFYYIKGTKKTISFLINESFALIPGLLIGLIIPINTPLWLIGLAAFLASFSKMVFGGLGKNPLNPALVGATIIIIFASSYIGTEGGYLNPYEIDAVSGATPLANLNALSYAGTYDEIVKPYGSLWSFFFGSIPGATGETSALLCIFAFIYLISYKVIKWRIPVTYIITVFIMSLIIGLFNGIGLWYPVFCILSGSVIFGAVFMTTDPVTSPITKTGQVIGGIILGILTIGIRYLTNYPEGVLISILIFNLITLLINKISIDINNNKYIRIFIISILIIIAISLSLIIGKKIDYKPITETNDPYFEIIDKELKDSNTIYHVKSRGFGGKKSIEANIIFNNNDIIKIDIIKTSDSYFNLIEEENYIDKLIQEQDSLEELDGVSGATYSSKYLKEMLLKVKKAHLK